jgi:RecB family exonuclease
LLQSNVPKKPSLSPTKLTTYLACPVRYRWTYLDPRGKWYLKSKSYYSFGTTLHRVLQRFHDEGDVGVSSVEQALAAYEESWIDAGYSSADEMQEAFGDGKAILEEHVGGELLAQKTSKTLYLERQISMDFDQFRLIGRVDRVEEHLDGSIEVIDYKSGRSSVSEEQVRSDLAMACYQLILKRKFPDRRVFATIIALRARDRASADLSDAELEEFEQDLVHLGDQILNDEWMDRIPAYKTICSDCDFLTLCRQHPDFCET